MGIKASVEVTPKMSSSVSVYEFDISALGFNITFNAGNIIVMLTNSNTPISAAIRHTMKYLSASPSLKIFVFSMISENIFLILYCQSLKCALFLNRLRCH